MKLSASNIAWSASQDKEIYRQMQSLGFAGLEIAPTRWFPEKPYEKIEEAAEYANKLKSEYGLSISSMQSIWYGHSEKITGSADERKSLLNYTEQALCFADAIKCPNLVFGCPRNRSIESPEQKAIVIDFLAELAHMAEHYDAVIALEPNPPIYNTNFANTTAEAVHIIEQIGSPALQLNLDFGTIIENEESLNDIKDFAALIHHVHISEPMLKPIQQRKEHCDLSKLLENIEYAGYVSLEMGQGNQEILMDALSSVYEVFR